jgi:glycosyltransferase involved in cell wall biosynthesis
MGGVQRVAKFAKYLPLFGWKPYVLTVKETDYPAKDYSLSEELPPEAQVIRTGSFDPLRISFALKSLLNMKRGKRQSPGGRWLAGWKISSWFFFPDSKVGWMPFALSRALRLCRSQKIDLVFSTSPPPSLHLTGHLAKLLTGIPWIADFRDPWIGYKLETFPTPLHLFLKERLRRLIVSRADRVIAANPAIMSDLQTRYPRMEKIRLINQGYDEEDFRAPEPSPSRTFTIGYLGTLSPDCDPGPFFSALGQWIDQKEIPKSKVRLKHVGLSTGIDVDALMEKHALVDVVIKKGYLSHRQALEEMRGVSLLLLVTSDHPSVFPAKIFEYLRLNKPLLCIVPPRSHVATFLADIEAAHVVSPDDKAGIARILHSCFSDFEKGQLGLKPALEKLKAFDRQSLTLSLASLFDEVVPRQC